MRAWKAIVCLIVLSNQPAAIGAEEPSAGASGASAEPGAGEPVVLDEISITATRAARPTLDVPQAITVVGKDKLQGMTLFNVKDALVGTPGVQVDSKNGGYDARLLIRGAGLKATYGIREIMLLRDGVPLTDPDSLTRLDWIDTQDIERIEVSKGPGNLYSPGSAGGAIQIISRSVFDRGADQARLSYGPGTWGAHLRASGHGDRLGAVALTASLREQDNEWRTRNHFDSKQVSLKHGFFPGDDATVESEVAYTQSNVQLPGAMDQEMFDEFLSTGRQEGTSEPWRHSGRYSSIVFANARLKQRLGDDLSFNPRLYYSQWTHRHPVTGAINDTRAWTHVAGTDLEGRHRHVLGPVAGTLVGGITLKAQWNEDSRKYQYRDVLLAGSRIVATLSDAEGALMERARQQNLLAGLFLQESLTFGRFIVDLGGRLDRSMFDVWTDEITTFDYASGSYRPGAGVTRLHKAMWLPAPKAGVTFKVTDEVSVYAAAAQAAQVPSESELDSNPALNPSRSTSYETGLKARTGLLTLDADVFLNPVKDEIVSVVSNGVTVFQNAGATDKKGAELSGSARVLPGLELGGAYAYSDFTYRVFVERVGGAQADRAGKRLPFVPMHQWALFAAYHHPVGVRVRAQTSTWGRYWMDSANTATYRGYAWVSSLVASFERGPHVLGVEAQNLFDGRFAMQASKDASGRVTYSAGGPRTVLFSWEVKL